MSEPMPAMSADLPHPRRPDTCQACGLTSNGFAGVRMTRWRECDERDRVTDTIVILCERCQRTLVEAHPRLYHEIGHASPVPGTMMMCGDCWFRDGFACGESKANGGPGVTFDPMPDRVHIKATDKKKSGLYWMGPQPKRCSGYIPLG